MITPDTRIHVAGHRGLVGSALVRALTARGCRNLLLRSHAELDLADRAATRAFMQAERPDIVLLAAARVGGIAANQARPAEFIADNLAIETSVIDAAWRCGVRRLLFLGSSCIYPRDAAQPIAESALLTGPLEPTNRPYALAKIAGIELCWSHNRQHGTRFLAVMPANLYGPGDNYHPTESHVIPALIARFHAAKRDGAPAVTVWGSGRPRREFVYSDDMAAACVHLMGLPDPEFDALLGSDEHLSGRFEPPLVNIGAGADLTIAELATAVAATVGYDGRIGFDPGKPDGTPRKLLDTGRITRAGWRPVIGLAEGLKRAYADYLARGLG